MIPANRYRAQPAADGIEYIGSNWNGANTVAMPAGVQAGDLLLFFATNGFISTPSLASGATNIGSGSVFRCGYKYAASSSETSGTWTNSNFTHVAVYRGATLGVTAWTGSNASSWPALSGFSTSAWVVLLGPGGTTNLTAPAGFVDRGGATSGNYRTRDFDTDGPNGATSIAATPTSPSVTYRFATLALEPA